MSVDDPGRDTPQRTERSIENTTMQRRKFLAAAGASAAALAVGTGTAAAEISDSDPDPDFQSDWLQNPWVNGSVTVSEHRDDMTSLDYVADDGAIDSLADAGFEIARDPDDEDQPHNPVTLRASEFYQVDADGNRQPHPEYGDFPRGAQYDKDGDGDAETDVSILDSTHFALTNATNGSISLADNSDGSLEVATSAVASGETVKATFDLSTVAASDQTISSGVDRKFLAGVFDVDALASGATVEVVARSSGGTEAVASIASGLDTSLESNWASSTGVSQVGQSRVGNLASLSDIQVIEIRVLDADATVTFHGLNCEKEVLWEWGDEEYQTTDSDGNTVVETQAITSPSGDFTVTGLDSLGDTPFDSSWIESVAYDVEVRPQEMGDSDVYARVTDTPDSYSYPKEFESVSVVDSPSAYSLSITFSDMKDEVKLPSSRYGGVEVATGISEIDEWSDVEDSISWTSKSSSYDSVGDAVTLYSSLAASDRTAFRQRIWLKEEEVSEAKQSSSAAAVGVSGGGGGGGFNWELTALLGSVGGLAVWFRKSILNALSG